MGESVNNLIAKLSQASASRQPRVKGGLWASFKGHNSSIHHGIGSSVKQMRAHLVVIHRHPSSLVRTKSLNALRALHEAAHVVQAGRTPPKN